MIASETMVQEATMDLEAYFARIGYVGTPRPDLATLTTLHRAHLQTIPYENFDVRLERPAGIEVDPAFDKLVTRRRGGWCYEMNGVLGAALDEIGFSVTRLAGAVMRSVRGDEVVGNHLVLKVDIDGVAYLADVGLGDGVLEPIPLVEGPHRVAGFDFRLERLDAEWWRLHNHEMGGARDFDFTLAPADPRRLSQMCQWLRTSPESMFTQATLAYRHTPQGWVVLLGRVLRRIQPGVREDSLVESAADLVATLDREFGLDLPEAASLWPAICAKHDELHATGMI
jgi:N-hydroxyarylamine O-acetyltransferase